VCDETSSYPRGKGSLSFEETTLTVRERSDGVEIKPGKAKPRKAPQKAASGLIVRKVEGDGGDSPPVQKPFRKENG